MNQKKLTKKIFKETINTLTALRSNPQMMEELPIQEIQLHILDDGGEGVVLCIEYDESTGELHKSFSTTDEDLEDEFYGSEEITHFEDIPSEKLDEWESEVLKSKGLLN